jgi:cbb3-type cytochrome oxidase subunit 3
MGFSVHISTFWLIVLLLSLFGMLILYRTKNKQ